MSTNFYLKPLEVDPITAAQDFKIHIGKHSGGWVFVFQGHKNIAGHSVMSTKQWAEFIAYASGFGWIIVNEYGSMVSPEEFWSRVESAKNGQRRDDGWHDTGNDFMDCDFF